MTAADLDALAADVMAHYAGPEHAALRLLITELLAVNAALSPPGFSRAGSC